MDATSHTNKIQGSAFKKDTALLTAMEQDASKGVQVLVLKWDLPNV